MYIRNGLLDHMSVAIKMVTYEEELKLLKEKINARKAKAEAKAKAKSDTKAHAQANKDELKLQNLAEKELGKAMVLPQEGKYVRIWCCLKCKRTFKYKESWTHHMQEALHVDVFTDGKSKAEAERIQMARIARLKLITKELKRRKSKKKELDDFKGQS